MYIDNKDPQFQKLIKMSHEECEKYMYETYPIMFREKNLTMEQSCMFWGCSIGVGWFQILDNACRKLQAIFNITGIQTVFTQIKEKFGTARFYYDTDTSQAMYIVNQKIVPMSEEQRDIWVDIISDIVSDAEDATVHTCAECGEHHYEDKPMTGCWVHDTCNKCVLKAKPELKEQFEKMEKFKDLKDSFDWLHNKLTPEEYATIEKTITDAQDRIEDASNKN